MVSMELSEEEARRITESRQQQTAVAERRVLIGFVIDESGSMANCVEVCRNGIPYPAKVTTIPHLDGGCLVVGVIYLGSTAGEKQALAFLTPLRRVGDAG